MAMSLQQVIDGFFQWAAGRLNVGTQDEYRRHFAGFLSYAGNLDAGDLRPHHLLLWGKTWHQVQAIQRLFNWACDTAELVERNPFKKVRRPPLGQRNRILHRAQLVNLMRRACPAFRRFLLAMRETIARPQEVRALLWEELHWPSMPEGLDQALATGECFFVLDEYKARKRRANPNTHRVILVSPRLGRLMVRLLRDGRKAEGLIFLNHKKQPWTANALRLQMSRDRRRCGLGLDHRGEQIVCYTVRHTVATQAAACGVRDKLLAELMGHTSTRTTNRYQHLDVKHLAAALKRIDFRM